MARKKKRGDAHVRLHAWVMKTPAWQSLTVGPTALLVALYSFYNGTNNGQLFLSIREAASRLKVSPNTVAPWFDVLIDRGFIKISQRGAFSLKTRHATSWILTEFAVGTALATREFARWRPTEEKQKPVSISDTDGIKNCVRGADLSPRKQAARYQKLTPSKSVEGANGIRNCDTDNLPPRGSSSNAAESEENRFETPSQSPAHQNGATSASRNDEPKQRRQA